MPRMEVECADKSDTDVGDLPVRACITTITLSLGVEGTDVRAIALVIGVGASKLFQHLLPCT